MENELNRKACEAYEARLEDFLAGQEPPAELRAHLERCPACHQAVESARLAGELLREGIAPAAPPAGYFATRVMANIRAQQAGAGGAGELWGALEVLARRLALTAAMALVLLGVYAGVSEATTDQSSSQQMDANAKYPSMVSQPNNSDEILQALVEVNHGR